MSKAKSRKTGAQQPPEDKYLSPADHIAMVTADKDAAVAAAEAERDAAKLQAFRLQTQLQIQQAESALKEARERAHALATARKGLAAELADRYAISWSDTALEPTLGQLVAIPKD